MPIPTAPSFPKKATEHLNISSIQIEKKQEYKLSENIKESLLILLSSSFPDYFEKRIYHKQPPSFRLLAFHNGELVGQVGVIYRVISVNQRYFSIFGIMDLCTKVEYKHKGIATLLMNEAEKLSIQYKIDHLFLFADEEQLYIKLGYKKVNSYCRWLAIEELTSIKVMEKHVGDILMIKSHTPFDFKETTIDLLGFLF